MFSSSSLFPLSTHAHTPTYTPTYPYTNKFPIDTHLCRSMYNLCPLSPSSVLFDVAADAALAANAFPSSRISAIPTVTPGSFTMGGALSPTSGATSTKGMQARMCPVPSCTATTGLCKRGMEHKAPRMMTSKGHVGHAAAKKKRRFQ